MAKSVSRGASVACWSASSKAAVVFGPLETHDRSDIDIGDSVELIFYTKNNIRMEFSSVDVSILCPPSQNLRTQFMFVIVLVGRCCNLCIRPLLVAYLFQINLPPQFCSPPQLSHYC